MDIDSGISENCFSTSNMRGEKSLSYEVPSEYWGGSPSKDRIISIQAAFECSEWTLIFCDHNVMISFHVMSL
jgi:hypothetical protein